MAGPAYFPSSELSKPHCRCCAKDLGEFKDKNYLNYRMNNKALFFCDENCRDYYTKGDPNTRIEIHGKHFRVISRNIQNMESCN